MTEKSKEQEAKEQEVARDTWDSGIGSREDKDQPQACSIDDEDCEACGS